MLCVAASFASLAKRHSPNFDVLRIHISEDPPVQRFYRIAVSMKGPNSMMFREETPLVVNVSTLNF